MLSKFLGPRYQQLVKNWMVSVGTVNVHPRCLVEVSQVHRIPTASVWGAVGTVGLVWATDWRLILDWVPYINGKFKDN